MKKLLGWLITVAILLLILTYKQEIVSYVLVNIIYPREFKVEAQNQYSSNNSFEFAQLTDDFTPANKDELINVFYTILNNGWNEFSFVCDLSYTNCLSDVQSILDDPYLLSDLNNFVHPYNSYNELKINMNNFGRIDVFVDKVYSAEEIALIDEEIDKITMLIIEDSMSTEEKIRAVHNYIINTTVYSSEDIVNGNRKTTTNTAYGSLINHIASCGGYTDAMALFLYDFGVLNYRISSAQHIWNLLYIDNEWKHLDLTWDDPVTSTGEDILLDKFFLISTEELETFDVEDHEFDKNIFREA